MSTPPDAPSNSPSDASADADRHTNDAGSSTEGNDQFTNDVDRPPAPEIDLHPALERLRVERRILGDEQSAFRSFCDRLLAIDDGAPTDAIVAHYRGTVMAVPHYWTEYGDTAAENIAAELGSGLARDLELRTRVDAATVTAIWRAGERSLQARDELVDRIDAERHAVATAAEALAAVRQELLALDVEESASGAGATRLTLASLRERCDAIARERRQQLQPGDEEGVATLSGSEDAGDDGEPSGDTGFDNVTGADHGTEFDHDMGPGHDPLPPGRLQALCYRELETDWPVLAGVDALRAAIERQRRTVLDRETGI